MKSESKTWWMILAAGLAVLGAEMVTVMVFGYPMSHAMADAPAIVVFVVGMLFGALPAHWWWPAKSRWRNQDLWIELHGNSSIDDEAFRQELMEIHREEDA